MIIQKSPNLNGAYPAPQNFKGNLPNGYAIINLDLTEFYAYNGFVTLTIEDDVVTSYTPNIEAWENWKPDPIIEARENALNRIKGKCSASIASGVVVDGKRYLLRKYDDQNALTAALEKARNGAETIPFKAVGDILPQPYTAAQIETIAQTAENWGQVNLSYRALLPVWITRETDVDVLKSINYGVPLPDDLMQELGTNLAGFGININNYADSLTGADTE